MNATPDQQREPGVTDHLIATLRNRIRDTPDGEPVAMRSDVLAALLDQISLEVPDPAPQPGDVAIATVRHNTEPETFSDDVLVIMDQYGVWQAPIEYAAYPQQDVRVTSRAAVVTEAAGNELLVPWESDTTYAGSFVIDELTEWFAALLGGERA